MGTVLLFLGGVIVLVVFVATLKSIFSLEFPQSLKPAGGADVPI